MFLRRLRERSYRPRKEEPPKRPRWRWARLDRDRPAGQPVDEVRRVRWGQVGRTRIEELPGYRLPIQVCPRGCEYHEAARRDLISRTALSGRVEMRDVLIFETTNCPKCGVRLVRECARCESLVFAPVVGRCQFCGLPQPWAAERRAAAERASVRLWHPDDPEVHEPARKLYEVKGRGALWVVEGDITRLAVKAVVSNDDVDGQMWSEVARAIRNAAGEEVEQRAQDGKPFKLGEAWVTDTQDLGAGQEHIIHVASMNRRGESSVKTVEACLIAAMDIAFEEEYESIGVGAFGSGPSAIDKWDWFRVFAETTVRRLAADGPPNGFSDAPALAVILVLLEPPEFDEEHKFLLEAVHRVHEGLSRPQWGRPEAIPPADEAAPAT